MVFKIIGSELFDEAFYLLRDSFRQCEMRPYEQQKQLLFNNSYILIGGFENGHLCAVIALWRLTGFVFLEHFAVKKEKRGMGLGAEVLYYLKNEYGAVVLETENDEDEYSIRRYNFYLRNGFTDSGVVYSQPPLSGDGSVSLKLMTFGTFIEPCELKRTIFVNVYKRACI